MSAQETRPDMDWRRPRAWSPDDPVWRMATLFMVGSLLFAIGSFPPYAQLVDPGTVGLTFVIGSIFFTVAALHQLAETVNVDDGTDRAPGSTHFLLWQPAQILWWAAVVQLVGTVLFNLNTIDALVESSSIEETNRLVWAPDFFGSIAFLIASHLSWRFVCQRLWCVHRDDADWWMSALNYVGSIFFMISAIAAFTLETTGEALNLTVVNSATFLGALCFLAGSYLLLPTEPTRSTL